LRGVAFDLVDRKLIPGVELGAVDPDDAIGARPRRDEGGTIDGDGQHEALVVVGVLTDQVHAPGGAHNKRRGRAEARHEGSVQLAKVEHARLQRKMGGKQVQCTTFRGRPRLPLGQEPGLRHGL